MVLVEVIQRTLKTCNTNSIVNEDNLHFNKQSLLKKTDNMHMLNVHEIFMRFVYEKVVHAWMIDGSKVICLRTPI